MKLILIFTYLFSLSVSWTANVDIQALATLSHVSEHGSVEKHHHGDHHHTHENKALTHTHGPKNRDKAEKQSGEHSHEHHIYMGHVSSVFDVNHSDEFTVRPRVYREKTPTSEPLFYSSAHIQGVFRPPIS